MRNRTPILTQNEALVASAVQRAERIMRKVDSINTNRWDLVLQPLATIPRFPHQIIPFHYFPQCGRGYDAAHGSLVVQRIGRREWLAIQG